MSEELQKTIAESLKYAGVWADKLAKCQIEDGIIGRLNLCGQLSQPIKENALIYETVTAHSLLSETPGDGKEVHLFAADNINEVKDKIVEIDGDPDHAVLGVLVGHKKMAYSIIKTVKFDIT